jgi:hypothetical protein
VRLALSVKKYMVFYAFLFGKETKTLEKKYALERNLGQE